MNNNHKMTLKFYLITNLFYIILINLHFLFEFNNNLLKLLIIILLDLPN